MAAEEKPLPITTGYKTLGDFAEEALLRKADWGRTNRFSTGIPQLDVYLGGGYGRRRGYELVLVFGPTGVGKSLVTLNLISKAMVDGERVGLMILEDDVEDLSLRLTYILSEDEWQQVNSRGNVVVLPQEAIEDKPWTLMMLLEQIKHWYLDLKLDLIVLDHIQFAFEGATAASAEQEYHSQRVFMRELRILLKRINQQLGPSSSKTFIYISHINKSVGTGMDRILGSSALQHTATKVISISRSQEAGHVDIQLWKSRFTAVPNSALTLRLEGGGKLKPKKSNIIGGAI
jgi:predicted ATP-dependent serine protease